MFISLPRPHFKSYFTIDNAWTQLFSKQYCFPNCRMSSPIKTQYANFVIVQYPILHLLKNTKKKLIKRRSKRRLRAKKIGRASRAASYSILLCTTVSHRGGRDPCLAIFFFFFFFAAPHPGRRPETNEEITRPHEHIHVLRARRVPLFKYVEDDALPPRGYTLCQYRLAPACISCGWFFFPSVFRFSDLLCRGRERLISMRLRLFPEWRMRARARAVFRFDEEFRAKIGVCYVMR